MKKIEKTIVKKGFKYTQIKRDGSKAIFLQERDDKDSVLKKYEVIVIKTHDGYEIGGNKIPPSEIYPSSTQWGTLGWTFDSLHDAETKYKSLKC
jgi:hypothetical protein